MREETVDEDEDEDEGHVGKMYSQCPPPPPPAIVLLPAAAKCSTNELHPSRTPPCLITDSKYAIHSSLAKETERARRFGCLPD